MVVGKQLDFNAEWWKSPEKMEAVAVANGAPDEQGNPGDKDSRTDNRNDYGSIPTNSSYPSSYQPNEDAGDEEEPSFLIDTVISSPLQDGAGNGDEQCSEISAQSSVNDSDGESCYTSSSEWEDEIEQPHRSLGLIFFDFVRFVALSANVRCINTQMFPVFLAWGKIGALNIALRIFISVFSLLLILVEFPTLLPILQYGSNEPPSRPPPLSLINWIPRGILYVFLALVSFEQTIVVRALDEAKHASTSSRFFDGFFIVLSAWIMLIVGAMYVLFGMFCLQRVMERVREDEREKWTAYYEELHKLEVEREEEEEREWLLENTGSEADTSDPYTIRGQCQRCFQNMQRWRKRCKRRRKRGSGGFFYQLGCRTVDWRC